MKFARTSAMIAFALMSFSAAAAEYPAPKQGDWTMHDFKFHTGEVLPELRIHYVTVGEPSGQPVLVLHGSALSAAAMLTPAFAGALFGAGHGVAYAADRALQFPRLPLSNLEPPAGWFRASTKRGPLLGAFWR